MGRRNFNKPIFLQHGRGGNFRADNASDALSYLERFWRGDRTREYRRAYAICQSALDNLASAESARDYVVAAAERAGLLDRRARIAAARGYREPLQA
ncbi:DUF982 domain-containing protein [Devosia albogilva]|uniref:DUF982 domain-containing protein n=1 Tax=Devosia albogilva TaxID=429726 RepID=A0ABW5QGZ2_9HYPH